MLLEKIEKSYSFYKASSNLFKDNQPWNEKRKSSDSIMTNLSIIGFEKGQFQFFEKARNLSKNLSGELDERDRKQVTSMKRKGAWRELVQF